VQPNVGSEAAQIEFIKQYQALKQETGAEILFMDGVHPQHNTNVSYGWYKANQQNVLPANTSRNRLNINAVLSPKTLELVYRSEAMLNAETTVQLLQDLEQRLPNKKIYVICDNARYYRAKIVTDYLSTSRIKLVFLPPYCPHLNLIERLWRFLKQRVLSNRYRQRFIEFKQSCFDFLDNLNDYASRLRTLLVDNFNILVPPFPKS
jgi:transposase